MECGKDMNVANKEMEGIDRIIDQIRSGMKTYTDEGRIEWREWGNI